MRKLLDGLSPGDVVRYAYFEDECMDGIVRGIRRDGATVGMFDLPGCDEDCVLVDFLVIENPMVAVRLACARECLSPVSNPEWRDFLCSNLAAAF